MEQEVNKETQLSLDLDLTGTTVKIPPRPDKNDERVKSLFLEYALSKYKKWLDPYDDFSLEDHDSFYDYFHCGFYDATKICIKLDSDSWAGVDDEIHDMVSILLNKFDSIVKDLETEWIIKYKVTPKYKVGDIGINPENKRPFVIIRVYDDIAGYYIKYTDKENIENTYFIVNFEVLHGWSDMKAKNDLH